MAEDTDISTLLTRIEQLEEKLAFQDQAIEDLNQTITEQWKVLDRYKREIERLESEVLQLGDNITPPGKEPPPPHY